MRVTTRIVMDKDFNVLEHEWYEYPDNYPVDKCDRWGSGQAKKNEADDTSKEATFSGEAQGEHAQLTPFFSQEMNAKHLYDPTQTNELLTAAEAGTGAAAGDVAAKTNDLAARSRNASGFVKSLQEQARDRDKAAAGASEGIAAQDVLGAKQLNQEGAKGLQGLYGTDTSGMLDAMGQKTKDEQAAVEAGKSGWLQNTLDTINTIAGAGKSLSGFKMPCWVAAATYGDWDHPRVPVVRNFLFNEWPKRSFVGKAVAALYLKFGERVAEHVKNSPLLKRVFKNLFDKIQ